MARAAQRLLGNIALKFGSIPELGIGVSRWLQRVGGLRGSGAGDNDLTADWDWPSIVGEGWSSRPRGGCFAVHAISGLEIVQ